MSKFGNAISKLNERRVPEIKKKNGKKHLLG